MRHVFLLWALSVPAQAALYSYVDADGTRVFTDQPQSSRALPVTLKPTNQMAADPENIPTRVLSPEREAQPSYQSLTIVSPTHDSTVQDGSGRLNVEVASEPALYPTHHYRLLINGQAQGAPSQETHLTIEYLDRGSQQLSVEIINEKNQRLMLSNAQTVQIRRISLNDRRRMNPCQLDDYGRRLECPLKDKPTPERDIPFIPFL